MAPPVMPAHPRVAVLMSTFNAAAALDLVLAGYAAQSRPPDQVVVADDGSGPDTAAVIAKWQAQAPFELRHVWQENQGFRKCRIMNRGLAAVRADYVILTDGDCLPHRDFVADHLALAETGFWVQGKRAQVKEAHAAAMKPEWAQGLTLWLKGWSWRSHYGLRTPWPLVWRQTGAVHRERAMGSNMAAWLSDLHAINGFNESFEGWGAEDRELTVRLFNLGRRKKLVVGQAVQFHLDHPPASRQRVQANGDLLQSVRQEKLVRCERGLADHLAQPASPA
jgi:glycosyltransferase involved in cell wall biosynthesis